jgi:predicted permease
MTWNDVLLRLRALRSPARAESELDDELQFHLEMEARKLREAGLSGPAARNAARAQFGGVEQVREQCRDVRGLSAVENLARDIRYGARMLAKSPVFTIVAVLSLAIGIGANTAVFTLVDAILLKMLPVKHPEQLVMLKWGTPRDIDVSTSYSTNDLDRRGRQSTNVLSWRIYDQLRRQTRTMDAVIGFSDLWKASVAANNRALVTDGMVVTGNYFTGLGVAPAAGRLLTADNDSAAGTPALVISYHLWDTVFGLDPDAIGKTVYVNAQPCTIVGVAPRRFTGLTPTHGVDLFLPIQARDRVAGVAKERVDWFADYFFWVQTIGRRRVGVSDGAMESEAAAAIAANLPPEAQRLLGADSPYVSAEPAGQGLNGWREYYRKPLLLIMAVVALTLLMACANLAGLLLARANARTREIMVRLALGARRRRLVRQLLVEGALLATAGAVAGLLVSYVGVHALLSLFATRSVEVTPDLRVLAFTIAVSVATTFLFALAPALRATRVDVAHGLKQETPSVSGQRFGAVRVLVAAQIAVALPLTAGALLLGRTLVNLRSAPVGFNAGNLVLFDLAPAQSGYDEVRAAQLYERILDRLRRTPGVTGATVSAERLLSGWVSNGRVRIEGRQRLAPSLFQFVGPDFFSVMQLPLVAGRGIVERDMNSPARAAVVNEAFARKYFGEGTPLGRRFRYSREDMRDVEIVGVARDAKYDKVRAEITPTIYAPYTQSPWGWPAKMAVEARVAGSPAAAVASIRRVMQQIDRGLPLMDMKTQQAQIDELLVQERLFAWLVSLFGAIALALAGIGLYGLVAASVGCRTREIGVRMALGASRPAVLRVILGQVAATALAGVALGLGATWAATRVIKATLFGVTEHDPATLAFAALAVLTLSIVAAAVPARRATRIDPVRALRYE